MGFILKKFQETAISDLRNSFLNLWKISNRNTILTFKSPTGSGKTVMMAQFLKDITSDPQFHVDKAFLWFSFNEESYLQSKNKLSDYYGGACEIKLLDLNDINNGKLENNEVFFINWQKLKTTTKEGRVLRTKGEQSCTFDELIKNTQNEGRELVLIIDEAHRDTDTDLAQELVDLIDPRIILKVTATPKSEPSISDVKHFRAGFVEVERDDVVKEGLIKEKIIVQTKEDLESAIEQDQDRILLELAYNRWKKLKQTYLQNNIEGVNPLVLIQLPNDDESLSETGQRMKIDIVKEYLDEKGVESTDIAVWLSNKKENLEDIEKNNSNISFLIFKQAAATGWDCPRASILVMFREIKSAIFHTQTVGRILRMPEAKHYSCVDLNIGYLYTNYDRNQIQLPDNKKGENKPFIYTSIKKENIKDINLLNTFMSRIDYGDLGLTFQKTFIEVANNYFNITLDDIIGKSVDKIKQYISVEDIHIENQMIIDAEIETFDDFVNQVKSNGKSLNIDISRNDLEKTYDLLCYQIIAQQEEEGKKYAPERSWGKLKSALNVWFKQNVSEDCYTNYMIIVNDLLKNERSVLRSIISEALSKYKPIRELEIEQRAMKAKEEMNWNIPAELHFTEDYEAINVSKSCNEPFYLRKSYNGKVNELLFINFLDTSEKVEWWFKNGDGGRAYFAVPYTNTSFQQERLFYVDFIIKLSDGSVMLFDTKNGVTANTEGRAEGLQAYIKKQNELGINLKGGIAIYSSGTWMYNDNDIYSYNPNNLAGWRKLTDIL